MKNFLIPFFLFVFAIFQAQNQDNLQERRDSIVNATQNELNSLKGERILSFHSDITVNKDASLLVTETISVYSNGDQIKRGIFRTLPLKRNLNGKSQKVKYKILSVRKNGVDEHYKEENGGSDLRIYLGQEDVLLDPGTYTYEIQFTATNQIGFFKNYDELYWNVNGTQWDFTAEEVSAVVHLPEGVSMIQNSCYTGEYGSNESNCNFQKISDREFSWTAKNLGANENLTIAVGFTKGFIPPPPPPSFFEKYGVITLLSLAFLGLLFYSYTSWKKYGIDPPKPVVYPQFNVPEDFSPASLGYIKNEEYKSEFITASIVNLAIKGFLQIKETENSGFLGFGKSKTFEIIKLKEPDQTIPKEEIVIMNGLLGKNSSLKLDGKYNSKVESAVDNFKANLKHQHEKLLNEGNNLKKLLIPISLVCGAYWIGLLISFYFDQELGPFIGGIFGFVLFSVVFIVLVFAVKTVKMSGCFIGVGIYFLISIFGSLITVFIGKSDAFSLIFPFSYKICYIFILLSFGVLLLYQYLIKRPSEEKLRQQSLIEGFKMYMGAAENEQLKFHNPPKITPEVFEKLLPFAMVMGVDAIWGKKFEQAMLASAVVYTQSWYIGNHMSFGSFGNQLNSSLTNSMQSSSTQPSSSGSGSGGGGFSGGGGGGGGGGGW